MSRKLFLSVLLTLGLMGMQGAQASMDDIVQTCRSNDSFHKAAAKNDLAYLNVCLSAGFPVDTGSVPLLLVFLPASCALHCCSSA